MELRGIDARASMKMQRMTSHELTACRSSRAGNISSIEQPKNEENLRAVSIGSALYLPFTIELTYGCV